MTSVMTTLEDLTSVFDRMTSVMTVLEDSTSVSDRMACWKDAEEETLL